jgi:acyl-CoA synthetase (AMP-forming)/AMP-acid ligase II
MNQPDFAIIYRSQYPDLEVAPTTLPEHILSAAATRDGHAAVVDATNAATVSYADLSAGIAAVAAGLAERGLAPGDRFALHAPNLPEWPVVFLGAMAAGAAVTTSSPLATPEELTWQLSRTRPRYALTIPPLVPIVRAAAEAAGCEELFTIGEADQTTPLRALLAAAQPAPPLTIAPESVAALPFSSGTTGVPKPVGLTHAGLIWNVHQIRSAYPVEPDSKVLLFAPMCHSFGQIVMSVTLSAGGTVVTLPKFDLAAVLQAVQEHRITHLFVMPPVMLALARHPLVDQYDLSSVQHVFCTAAPLRAEVEQAVADRLGCDVGQGFGMTEAGPAVSVPDRAAPHRGTCGRLLPNTEARIVDPATGRDLPPAAIGELWLRGPQLFAGYPDDPAATAATVDTDGWLHTGDLARFDDGFLTITDRLKELIKVRGQQVAPAELEQVIAGHAQVADVAVIGRPDEEAVEIPVAYVVPRGDLDPQALAGWVAERVSPHKRLADVVIVEEIPRSPAGKLLRRVLRDLDRAREVVAVP